MENNRNKKSVKFQGDMLNFCDFIQVFVFTRNHHLKYIDNILWNMLVDVSVDLRTSVGILSFIGGKNSILGLS